MGKTNDENRVSAAYAQRRYELDVSRSADVFNARWIPDHVWDESMRDLNEAKRLLLGY